MVQKVVLLGSTGFVGMQIAREFAERGTFEVTAIARDPSKVYQGKGITGVTGDASSADDIAEKLQGADVLVSAMQHTIPASTMLAALRKAKVNRFVVVGAASTLKVSPDGPILFESKTFSDEFKPKAEAAIEFLKELRAETDIDWTFFCPPISLNPGDKTRKFRVGSDTILRDSEGNSKISVEDFAVGIVDEVVKDEHKRAQATAAY